MIGCGRFLKEVHKEPNIKEEDENLNHIDDQEADDIEEATYVVIARWNWYKQNYFIDR